jgi:hypothetical protein
MNFHIYVGAVEFSNFIGTYLYVDKGWLEFQIRPFQVNNSNIVMSNLRLG